MEGEALCVIRIPMGLCGVICGVPSGCAGHASYSDILRYEVYL